MAGLDVGDIDAHDTGSGGGKDAARARAANFMA